MAASALPPGGSIVLDVSVVGAYLFNEPNTTLARPVCQKIVRGELAAFVPDLYWAELQNICRRKRDQNGLSLADIEQAYQDAQGLPVAEEASALARYRSRAWDLVRQLAGVGSYDCYYLALALDLGIPLWTFDRRFRDAVRPVGGQLAGVVLVVGEDVIL
ncbi:MAG: type II toxin-antitoxin system VapC family toxin [Armatimonadetes bacterium]|nr:type II toxin-antitoxin system VapC family toxin [Armatimonadota bacterium]